MVTKAKDFDKNTRFKLENDPNFVHSPSLGNDLEAVLNKHPDGCTDRVIASLLQIEVEEIEEIYQDIVKKLRVKMKVE